MFGGFFGFPMASPSSFGDDQVEIVDARKVKEWVADGEAILVDVREANEYLAERIPGAVHVPLSAFDTGRIPPADGKKLVVHCRSGSRCGLASLYLLQRGHQGKIYRLQGGILGWKAAGGAVEKSAAA